MPGPSTRNLLALPAIPALRNLTRAIATLEAIIEPDWEFRYYSFNSKWSADRQMASMRNGQGDEWFLVFAPQGAFLKGFDHESPMSPWGNDHHQIWPGVLDQVPPEYSEFLREPAFSIQDTTFCVWRTMDDPSWNRGNINYPQDPDPDGSEWMLNVLDGNPETYQRWAQEYYEREIPMKAIKDCYASKPITREIVALLNPQSSLETLAKDLEEIGVPRAD